MTIRAQYLFPVERMAMQRLQSHLAMDISIKGKVLNTMVIVIACIERMDIIISMIELTNGVV